MDLPLALEQLTKSGRILPSDDWGPRATTGTPYPDFASGWRGVSPVPTEQELIDAFAAIPPPTEAEKFDQVKFRPRVLAALTLRASSQWANLSAARRNRVQSIIDNAASDLIALLT
jgi:hypothetical protein